MEIDGTFVFEDALRLLLLFGALALAFWAGKTYEQVMQKVDEEEFRE